MTDGANVTLFPGQPRPTPPRPPKSPASLGPKTGRIFSAADLHGLPVPLRKWVVEDLIPAGAVTMLSGDGGTGKSLLALQLALAATVGHMWLDRPVAPGPALFVTAEDSTDELHRRLANISHDVSTPLVAAPSLLLLSLAGEDALLTTLKGSALTETRRFGSLQESVRKAKPALVVLDTLADFFGGDENNRGQARQFIGLLTGLAMKRNTTILLLAHPSVAGIATKTGLSGSTAWNASVRSRLYLDRVRDDQGNEPDPNARVLRTVKANHGPTGTEIKLRWNRGVFTTSHRPSYSTLVSHAGDDDVFLTLLRAYAADGRNVTSTTGHGYAPAIFAKDSRAGGLSKAALVNAMNRLFEAGRIVNVEHGPPSRRYRRIETATEARR